MPRMNGVEFLTVLKNKPETACIPTVILAGKSSTNPSTAEHLANYVMFKDIDIEVQLRNAMIQVLGTDVAPVAEKVRVH
jgi:CheY-like chemotaxis protein